MNDGLASSGLPSRAVAGLKRPAVKTDEAARRPIVMVLGMHRSGTSLCAHVLSALGVDMSEDLDITPSNPKGHWERRAIVELHDRILKVLNRDYYSPLHDLPLPLAWWADPEIAELRREIVGVLQRTMNGGWYGVKDPRTARLMPIWHQIFNELKLSPRIILCLRNPAEVARSLAARDGLDAELGEYRWFSYVLDAFRYSKDHELCIIEYESWFNEAAQNIAKLQQFLGLSSELNEFDVSLTLPEIVDRQLRHDERPNRQAGQPLVRLLYKLARHGAPGSAAREQIDNLISEFISLQQLQRGFHREFERNAVLAIEREQVVGERDQAAAELAAARAERDQLASELTATRERLTDEQSERDRLAAELSTVREERDRLATAQVERDALATALAKAREEHDRLAGDRDIALSDAQRMAAERDAMEMYRTLLLQSLDSVTNERDAARAEREDMRAEGALLKTECARFEAHLEAERARLDAECARLAAAAERAAAMSDRLAGRDRVIDALKAELSRLVRRQVAADLGIGRLSRWRMARAIRKNSRIIDAQLAKPL